MTLKKIAERAGVSVSTVSRVINTPDGSFASKDVQERVWAIIKETGYTPNQNARELKKGNAPHSASASGALTCVLGRTRAADDNPFFARLLRIIEQRAMERGYPVRMSYSVFDIMEKNGLEQINADKPDGAIVLGLFNGKATEFLQKYYRNLVYVGRNVIDAAWDQVICDGYEATRAAMSHLIAFGHRRIAYIGETAGEIRYKAYSEILRANGLEANAELVVSCSHNSAEKAYAGADKLLSQAPALPTAVFCASDVAAIAALRRFADAKIKVPGQISVIGMDNIEMSGCVTPMLTTVGMPVEELGGVAVGTIIDRIKKRHRLPLKIYLPNKIVIRESVANLNIGAGI